MKNVCLAGTAAANLYGTFDTLSMLLSIRCCIGNFSVSFLLLAAVGGGVELAAAAAPGAVAGAAPAASSKRVRRLHAHSLTLINFLTSSLSNMSNCRGEVAPMRLPSMLSACTALHTTTLLEREHARRM